MSDVNYDKLISEKVTEGEELIQKIKDQIEELAEKGRTIAYWGEYGTSGETYYSTGYVEDNKDEDGMVDYIDFGDNRWSEQPGSWIASSDMC